MPSSVRRLITSPLKTKREKYTEAVRAETGKEKLQAALDEKNEREELIRRIRCSVISSHPHWAYFEANLKAKLLAVAPAIVKRKFVRGKLKDDLNFSIAATLTCGRKSTQIPDRLTSHRLASVYALQRQSCSAHCTPHSALRPLQCKIGTAFLVLPLSNVLFSISFRLTCSLKTESPSF